MTRQLRFDTLNVDVRQGSKLFQLNAAQLGKCDCVIMFSNIKSTEWFHFPVSLICTSVFSCLIPSMNVVQISRGMIYVVVYFVGFSAIVILALITKHGLCSFVGLPKIRKILLINRHQHTDNNNVFFTVDLIRHAFLCDVLLRIPRFQVK